MGRGNRLGAPSPNYCNFYGIVGMAPRQPDGKRKRVELQLEYLGNHDEHRPHGRIYIDEGILGQFDDELEEVLQIERYLQCRHPIEYRTESEHPTAMMGASVAYLSSAPEDQGDEWRRQKAFSAGWYWKVDAEGDEPVGRVCLDVPRHPGGQFYFPKATLEQLIEIVGDGRAFLAAN